MSRGEWAGEAHGGPQEAGGTSDGPERTGTARDEVGRLWDRIRDALVEPRVFTLPDGEQFHAWFDELQGEAGTLWTKPLAGARQVRLSSTRENLAKVYRASRQGLGEDPEVYRHVTLRGHYLFAILREVAGPFHGRPESADEGGGPGDS